MHYPSCQQAFEKILAHECPDSSWHAEIPIVITAGKGSWFWDLDGHKYLDFCAGFGALPFGHNPEFYQDIWQCYQNHEMPPLVHGLGDVLAHENKIKLLETLHTMLPPQLSKSLLTLGGGQAVEAALKTAMLKTKHFGFIYCTNAYHGLDLGVLTITDRDDFQKPFQPWLHKDYVEPIPFGASPISDYLAQAKKQLKQRGVELAAVICEPIQGRAGMRHVALSWLHEVNQWCHQDGSCLFILDEIFSGLGRCGQLTFAQDLDPDIICLGKALGCGLPLSACVGKKEVMDAWPCNRGEAIHTATYFGHPLSCAMAHRSLIEMNKLKIWEQSREKGEQLRTQLNDLVHQYSFIEAVTGQGLMIALRFKHKFLGVKLFKKLLYEEKMLCLPSGPTGECLSLTPPLNVSTSELEIGYYKLTKALFNLANDQGFV